MNTIKQIIIKSLTEDLLPQEVEQLNVWLEESDGHRLMYDRVIKGEVLKERSELVEQIDVEQALRKNSHLLLRRQGRRMTMRILPYAAVFVLGLLVVAGLLTWSGEQGETKSIFTEMKINPAENAAQLMLASGEVVELDSNRNRMIQLGQAEVNIGMNTVRYENGKRTGKVEYNKINIPQGGGYSLVLSDGTKVYFNAMSEMEFPVSFDEGERRVKLKGEAYFEVTKDVNRPFVVEVDDYEVNVLGTSFNVAAYASEKLVRTTLCTGRVRVSAIKGMVGSEIDIEPGEQMSWNKESLKCEVKKVDTSVFTAWLHNDFYFSDNTVEEIFSVLQRWYDIQVFFSNDECRGQKFSGKFSRSKSMNTIMEVMKKAGVRISQNGNVIMIE